MQTQFEQGQVLADRWAFIDFLNNLICEFVFGYSTDKQTN